MSATKDATLSIEKLIRATRLNDVDLLMRGGQAQRAAEILDALSKLEPGAYLVGCGPYTQRIHRLSTGETVVGREATLHEEALGRALDVIVSDAVTYRPREVSRIHMKINRQDIGGQTIHFITDLGSTLGTYVNGERL